jgi:SrtB family sortase
LGRFAPRKRRRRPFEAVFAAVFACVFLASVGRIAYIEIDYALASREYDALRSLVTFTVPETAQTATTVSVTSSAASSPGASADESSGNLPGSAEQASAEQNGGIAEQDADAQNVSGANVQISVDFDELRSINAEMVAWLYVSGTNISYPVTLTDDNDKYLHTSFEGKRSSGGCVFLNAGSNGDFSDLHSIVYGHNMRNGTMFGELDKLSERGFFDANREIILVLPDKQVNYTIFASYVTSVEATYTVDFADKDAFSTWVKQMYALSWFKLDGGGAEVGAFEPSEVANVLTLSTCIGDGDYSKRRVVHAYLSE